MRDKIVCIVGLGYVGLPLANAFSKHLKVIGFDLDEEKVKRLNESNTKENIEFTADPAQIKQADFVLICVPTPVTKSKEPDLSYAKLFCFAKTFTKNASTIRSRDCWKEFKEWRNSSLRINSLSGCN